MFKTYQKKWYHAQGLDAKTISERVTYKVVPLKVMIYVAKIVRESKKELKKITAPILIMQSRTDWGVGEGSVDYIYKKVSSNIKKIVWLDDAYHVVTVGKNKEIAFEQIYEFINEIH
jgi:carboxylesterase